MKKLLPILFIFLSCNNNTVTINGKEVKAIPGLTAADVYKNLSNKDFAVKENTVDEPNTWLYIKNGYGYQNSIMIEGKNETKIIAVTATYSGGTTLPQTADFLGDVAGIPYEGSKPQVAKNWVLRNNSTDTIIGNVKLEMIRNNNATTLKIYVP